jgi:hypothetical protein
MKKDGHIKETRNYSNISRTPNLLNLGTLVYLVCGACLAELRMARRHEEFLAKELESNRSASSRRSHPFVGSERRTESG